MSAYGNPNGANPGMLDKKDVGHQPINMDSMLYSTDPFPRFLG